jgi:hypothetical protein
MDVVGCAVGSVMLVDAALGIVEFLVVLASAVAKSVAHLTANLSSLLGSVLPDCSYRRTSG